MIAVSDSAQHIANSDMCRSEDAFQCSDEQAPSMINLADELAPFVACIQQVPTPINTKSISGAGCLSVSSCFFFFSVDNFSFHIEKKRMLKWQANE